MARYIKRYIIALLLVFITISLLVYIIHTKTGVTLDKTFLKEALGIIKYNFNFIFFTTIFLTVFYFFQTREFDSMKALIFSFLILSVINTAFILAYLYKPKVNDVNKYKVINPAVKYRYDIFKKNDILLGKDFLIKYKNFDKKNKKFHNITAVNLRTGAGYKSDTGIIGKIDDKYYLQLINPFSMESNAGMKYFNIRVFEKTKTNPFFKKAFIVYHTLNSKYLFYNHLIQRQSSKKNIWYYLNTFLIVMGLNSVFMIFGLFYTLESRRIVNIAISISMIPIIYLAIYFIYKIPFYKLNFLKKGFLININFGILMFAIALVLFVLALFRVKSNSHRGA